MSIAERNKALREQWVHRMEADFVPDYTPETSPKPELRMMIATEYAAYQLGKISQSLTKLTALLEAQAAKK
jgi:hypothetical protein